jgi:broad specificity phosphatase PhoE
MVIINKGGTLVQPMRERELVLVRHAETEHDDRLEDIADEEVLSVVGAGIMKSSGARSAPELLGLRPSYEPVVTQFFRDAETLVPAATSMPSDKPAPRAARAHDDRRADPPLSKRGLRQAAALAARLDDEPPAVLVTSARRGPVDTGDAIARRHGIVASADPRLDDADYGAWTGLDEAARRARWPTLHEQYLRAPEGMVFPGGEALAAVQARAWDIVTEMSASDRFERVVLVTHDAILRLIVCRILGAPLATMHDMRFGFASTTGLRVRDRVPVIEWLDARSDVGLSR